MKRPFANRIGVLVLGLLVGLSGSARAALVTYFGEDPGQGESVRLASHPNADAAANQFLAQLTGVGTETFEGFASGTGLPLVLTFSGAGTATLTGGGSTVQSVPSGTNGFGRYPISGNNYLETSSSGLAASFSSPVSAFGFYATDVGDFNGQLTLTVTRVGGATETVTVPNTLNGTGGGVLFFGIIDASDPFTNVAFGNTAPGADVFGFDDLTIGSPEQVISAAPEPSTLVSGALAGLIGLGYGWRRRRPSAA